MSRTTVPRRSALHFGIAAAGLTIATAGCGESRPSSRPSRSESSTTPAVSTSVAGTPSASTSGQSRRLPSLVPLVAEKPDLPALDNGTPAGYLAYPANPKTFHQQPPASGGTISFLKAGDVPQPLPMSKNQWWQELNKRVGATMDITQIVSTDYPAKLSTAIAGGDLPDVTQMRYDVTKLPQVLQAEFEDLSPWLAGDAVKQFPSLAALPTYGWQSVSFNGGLWGVPWCFSSTVGHDIRTRQDIFDSVGFTGSLADGKDLLALCKELTDVKHSRWAIGDLQYTTANMALEMAGAPNMWKESAGKFTRAIETDEYKSGLSIANQIWKAGYVYPDPSASLVLGKTLLLGGKAVMLSQAYTNWGVFAAQGATDPNFRQGGLVLPKWEGGGQAGQYLSSGVSTFTAIKKADASRVEELLTVMDWFASPFGSAEYLYTHYGISGRDYTLSGTDPKETPTGTTECVNMEMSYFATTPLPLYIAGLPEQTKTQYDEISQLMKSTVPLPTVGLYSDTALSIGKTAEKNIASLQADIIAGRKPISSWDAGVKAWRSAGGDKMRAEYEESYTKAHS